MVASPYSLEHLSNTQLLESLASINARTARLTADLLAHLAEVDARTLYLEQGFSSLFAYCLHLGYSEDEAAKRIQAARAARSYPVLFEKIAAGELHLSAVNLLAPHLDGPHGTQLIAAAIGKTKRQVEEMLAARFPKPNVMPSLRRLPAAKLLGAEACPVPPQPEPALLFGARAAAVMPVLEPTPSAAFVPPPPPKSRPVVAPLSAEHFKLQVTISRQARDLLQRAQALLGHSGPKAELGQVIERALGLLCDELEHRKFGKPKAKHHAPELPAPRTADAPVTEHAPAHVAPQPDSAIEPAPSSPPIEAAQPAGPQPDSLPAPMAAGRKDKTHSRYIPRAVRRAVAQRDAYRCAYTSAQGRRCDATRGLEFHHRRPFAWGGEATVDGLELRCRGHNDLAACLDFGEAHMAAAKQRSATQSPGLLAGP